MSETISNLLVRIGADTTALRKGLVDSKKEVDSFSTKVRKGSTDLIKYGASASAAGAAIATALIAKTLGAIDSQAKLAQQLGTTTSSMATLERAGGLAGVGMDKISTAGRQLDVALGRAAQGVKTQSDALSKLGLSAEYLSSIPLDRRIAEINAAINENIPATEQAAVAAELFGTRNASAMMMLDSGVLETAAHQAQLFGTALDDVDAAKVEQANDAISTISMGFDGLIKQATVRLAPIIKAIGDEFFLAAEEGENMGERVDSVFEHLIDGTAFVVNAVDGIKRVFLVVADSIIAAFSKAAEWITDKFANVLEGLSKLPKVDFSETVASLRGFSSKASEVVEGAMNNIDANLSKPLAGDAFREFVANAQVAGEAAARAAITAREGVPGGDVSTTKDGGESDSPDDSVDTALQSKIQRIQQAHMTELELLEQKYDKEQEIIDAAEAAKLITEDEWNLLTLQHHQAFQDELTSIEEDAAKKRELIAEAEAAAKKKAFVDTLSNLSTLMNTESRKMFEIGKAAAIANSIVSTYTGIAKALELPYPMNLVAAAATGAAGFAAVQNIQRQSFRGGGGASGSVTQSINDNSTPVQSQQSPSSGTLTVSGLNPGSLFTGDAVAEIAEELLDYQRRGGQVVLAS